MAECSVSDLTLSIQCFGIFRTLGDFLNITVEAGASVCQVKAALVQKLGETYHTVVAQSVLANEQTILPGHYVFQREEAIFIFPPVCGG